MENIVADPEVLKIKIVKSGLIVTCYDTRNPEDPFQVRILVGVPNSEFEGVLDISEESLVAKAILNQPIGTTVAIPAEEPYDLFIQGIRKPGEAPSAV